MTKIMKKYKNNKYFNKEKTKYNKYKNKKKYILIYNGEKKHYSINPFKSYFTPQLRKFSLDGNDTKTFSIKGSLSRRNFYKRKKLTKYFFKQKIEKALFSRNNFVKKITIKIVQNNIFCTLIDLSLKKTVHTCSSGIYKVKISKRKLKRIYEEFINEFFLQIKKRIKNLHRTIFNIITPKYIRKKVCRIIKTQLIEIKIRKENKKTPQLKKKYVLINVLPKKCFNGCKAKKKIRKKRRYYRIFK
jgi:hypothetical protein